MASLPKTVPIPPRGVDYRGKIVLAPMVRSGELPSRLLALQYGADLVWGPETIDRSLIGTTRHLNPRNNAIEWTRPQNSGQKTPAPDAKESIIYRIHPALETGKLIFQIGTADPARAVAAARMVAADVAGIDVNAGCPKPFSVHGGMGAALLRTPDRLCAILEALVRDITPEFEIGISVKIRLLETPEETEALVRRLCATGITGLTVHCRTTPMRPRERAIREQLRMIVGLCHEAGVACLMNGDVEDREQAVQLMEEFGADGAMIASAAERNPSCFRTAAQGGLAPWTEVAETYFKLAMEVENRFGNTKFLLGHIMPGKATSRVAVTQSRTYGRVCELLGLEHLSELAQETDRRLGLLEVTRNGKKDKQTSKGVGTGGSGEASAIHNQHHQHKRKSGAEDGQLGEKEEKRQKTMASEGVAVSVAVG